LTLEMCDRQMTRQQGRDDWSDHLNPPFPLEGEVRVWRVGLEWQESAERLGQLLDDDEHERVARFHFSRDAMRFLVGRAAVRSILGDVLGIEPRRLCFGYGPSGKPEIVGAGAERGLRFNVSRSNNLALCAVTTHRRVGVDVECLRALGDLDAIVERVFSRPERDELRSLPPELREVAFFNGWTRKEAYVKAIGEGVASPLDRFTVSLAPGSPARLVEVGGDPTEAARWTLATIFPDPGYAAALAVEGPIARLRCHTWQP
jgi:4'-phosphopantetheinyl transferase